MRVNCTSGGFSRPPTKLTWFINGEAANSAYLREYEPIVNARGLVLTRLGLEFTARQRHFLMGDLKLKVSSSEYCGKLYRQITHTAVRPFYSAWLPLRLFIGGRMRKVQPTTDNNINRPFRFLGRSGPPLQFCPVAVQLISVAYHLN